MVRGAVNARVAWVACVALAVLGVAAELAKPATADMGFFLYSAGRVLDGARLYRDVVDLNPPLIFALNLPVVALARETGLSEFLLYRLGTALFVGSLLLYSARLILRYVLPAEPARARYLVLLLCFAVFALPRVDFGQREHFVLALLVPYLLLVAGECAGHRVPGVEAGIIGIMAGAAIGLKPQFGLVWVVLEAFRRVRCAPAERWRPTPEMAGVLGFLAVYGVAVVWLTPDYLTVASLLGQPYVRYMREPFLELLLVGPGAPLVGLVLLALLVLRRRMRWPVLGSLVAWATVACFLAAAVQGKNFRYHFYPALALAFVLLGLAAADAPAAPQRLSERIYGRASRALLATIALVVLGWAVLELAGGDAGERRERAEFGELVRAVRERAGGRPVGVLSYTMESSFPLANYAGVGLASRFPCLWVLPVSYWDAIETGGPLQYHAVGEMAPVERYFLRAVREDLTTARPSLLIVLRPARDTAINGQRRLHYLQYFGRDSTLAALLAEFRLADRRGEYLLYERREAGAVAIDPPPSAAPGTQDVIKPELKDLHLGYLDRESVVGLAVFVAWWVAMAARDRRRSAA
jgi:hypothetical protein